jgi:hypothetical protein
MICGIVKNEPTEAWGINVAAAPEGMDGITYLIDAIRSGIETPLTADYKAEILKQTVTLTLEEALKAAKDGQ